MAPGKRAVWNKISTARFVFAAPFLLWADTRCARRSAFGAVRSGRVSAPWPATAAPAIQCKQGSR